MTATDSRVDATARVGGEAFSLGPGLVADPLRNKITLDGRAKSVEPRVMELLVYLAQRPGEVISKSELIEQVWQAHVVDEAVHRAVSLLRTALADSRQTPTFIETVPRRGYRLLVEPEIVGQSTGHTPEWRRWLRPAAAVAVAATILLVFAFQLDRKTPPLSPTPLGSAARAAPPAERDTPSADQAERLGPAAAPRAHEQPIDKRPAEELAAPTAFAPEAPAPRTNVDRTGQSALSPAAVEAPPAEAPKAPRSNH